MSRLSRLVLFAILILATIVAILAYRYKGQTVHSSSMVADAPRSPITVQGVAEPEEMLVEPFPAYAPTEPEKMLGDAMKEARGNSDPNALLPALNRILGKYPDYSDGYAIRLGILCSGKDRPAIVSDITMPSSTRRTRRSQKKRRPRCFP